MKGPVQPLLDASRRSWPAFPNPRPKVFGLPTLVRIPNMKRAYLLFLTLMLCFAQGADDVPARWSVTRANNWYANEPWLVGANYAPAYASNQLEMWQAETWDPAAIERELTWAHELGFNVMRVFLHDLAWQDDPVGFLTRFDQFLSIAAGRQIAISRFFSTACGIHSRAAARSPRPGPTCTTPVGCKVLAPLRWPTRRSMPGWNGM
jgi:hypothetical protein